MQQYKLQTSDVTLQINLLRVRNWLLLTILPLYDDAIQIKFQIDAMINYIN